ncbi:MSC_0621 family F1-like ATPase epsilon subunit [Mycoplasmopsis canis]|uniref:MSC_0621 family F1-like ATPase epsilon subunit n=1 Tax=Mycoplasmopsis canis TaxID=29555 RepID=UPI003A5C8679
MNKESNNVFFVFLENANFVVTNDEIDIKTFSEMNFFKESKKTCSAKWRKYQPIKKEF